MSGINETRFPVQFESCDCKCVLNESVHNSKKNHDECRCECKELNDWGTCKNKYVWNPKKYNCKCNKACKIDEYLDIKVCSREKRLFCKLALECENEILNTAETSLDDKEVTCKK